MEDDRKFSNLRISYRSRMGSKLGDTFVFGSGTSKRKQSFILSNKRTQQLLNESKRKLRLVIVNEKFMCVVGV